MTAAGPPPRADLPGPRPFPLLGARANLIPLSRDPVGAVGALFRRYGPLVAAVGGDVNAHPRLARWVFAHGPELAQEVVTQHRVYHKPPLTKQLRPEGDDLTPRQAALRRWGAGLFGVNEDEHKAHRRLLMPAFHRSRVEGYRDDMVAVTEDELARWRPGTVRDVREDMMALTLRIAARTLLGEDVRGRGEGSVGALVQRALGLILRPTVTLLPLDLPGLPYRRFLDAVEETDLAIRRTIAEKRARGADGDDVLSMLLHARDADGAALSEEHLIEHTNVIFIAGHETSSNALTWTLFLLSQHPRVAADLLDELDGRLRGGAPTIAQLAELPLLDGVVKESLRLLPPVPLNARVVGHDTELRGHPLKVGTNVVMSLFHTHRQPDVFPRPDAFDPRRWERASPGPYDYAPFGTGPRTCIGAAFASMEIKLVLAVLLQRFRLEFMPGTRVDRFTTITMSVRGSLPMKVVAQDRRFERGVGGVRGNVREMVALGEPRP